MVAKYLGQTYPFLLMLLLRERSGYVGYVALPRDLSTDSTDLFRQCLPSSRWGLEGSRAPQVLADAKPGAPSKCFNSLACDATTATTYRRVL